MPPLGRHPLAGTLTPHSYNIKCKHLDSAVSADRSVGFTHWRSTIAPKAGGPSFTIDGVEVDVFGADGKIKDIWCGCG